MSDENVGVQRDEKSQDEKYEEKYGSKGRPEGRTIEEEIHAREKGIRDENVMEANADRKEIAEIRDADEAVQHHINEDILDNARGFRHKQSGYGGLTASAEDIQQAYEQKQIDPHRGHVHMLGSSYRQHTENLTRGRAHSFAPIPLPPVNEFNMYPVNQFPVESSVYLTPYQLVQREREDPAILRNFDYLIQPDPTTEFKNRSNIPFIQQQVNPGVEIAEMVSATPEFNELLHPLNKRFTISEDPYNEGGKAFRNNAGVGANSNPLLSNQHITGQQTAVPPRTPATQQFPLSATEEDVKEKTMKKQLEMKTSVKPGPTRAIF